MEAFIGLKDARNVWWRPDGAVETWNFMYMSHDMPACYDAGKNNIRREARDKSSRFWMIALLLEETEPIN